MADRVDSYTGQLMTQQDFDLPFTFLENALWNLVKDLGFNGIISGFGVTENTPNGMSLIVSSGLGHSTDGNRCIIAEPTTVVDMTIDRNGDDTAVLTPGAKRWVSIIVTPDRELLDVRADINNFPVYYKRLEMAKFEVIMSGEGAPEPSRMPVPDESFLVCDVLIELGQSTIVDAQINLDRVVYFASYEYNGSVIILPTYRDVLQAAIDLLVAHESSGTHPWTVVTTEHVYGYWANGNAWLPLPPANVTLDTALETWVVNSLASTNNPSGVHRLGCFTSSYQSGAGVPTIASGTLFARLEAMRDATNIYLPALAAWAGGDNPTNPAASLVTSLTKLVNNLGASSSQTDQGIRRIGVHGTGYSLASWQALGATAVHGVFLGLNSVGATDGASYVAAKASGALAAGTVRSQLDALDTRVTTNAGNITANAMAIAAKVPQVTAWETDSPTFTTAITSIFQNADIVAYSTIGLPPTTDCQVGDIISITYSTTANVTVSAAAVSIFVKEPSMVLGGVRITGTTKVVPVGNGQPVTVTATWTVTEAGELFIYGMAKAGTGGTITHVTGTRLDAIRMR